MRILVINSGSSSIKFRLYDMEQEIPLLSGTLERVGEHSSRCVYRHFISATQVETRQEDLPIANHNAGVEKIFSILERYGTTASKPAFDAVAHRVVHGGQLFRAPVLIDDKVIAGIRGLIPMSPLHNAINLTGIEAIRRLRPQIPQVAVFDTAFFQNLPAHAHQYALPYELARQQQIRRYGFHGISHHHVASRAAAMLQQSLSTLRLITLHLGNGASAAAIRDGVCIDTSMGMTPLEGLIMGTRCGDLDPSVPAYLARRLGMQLDDIDALLNHASGMKGLCGSSDMRDVHRLADDGNEQAQLAIEMYCYRICKYIGAYYAVLGGLDALVFTGGVGENDVLIRELVCGRLAALGISLNGHKNRHQAADAREITGKHSRVRLLVIPANEELEIARQGAALINETGTA